MKVLSSLSLSAILIALAPQRASSDPNMPSSPVEVRIDETADATTVTARTGDRLMVRLPAVPGTGHAWTLVRDAPAILEQLGASTFEPFGGEGSGPRVGEPAHQVFRFAAKGSGVAEIELVYRAPGAQEVARRFRVRIEVR